MLGILLKLNLHVTGFIFSVILLFAVSDINYVIWHLIFLTFTHFPFPLILVYFLLSFHRNHVFLHPFEDVKTFLHSILISKVDSTQWLCLLVLVPHTGSVGQWPVFASRPREWITLGSVLPLSGSWSQSLLSAPWGQTHLLCACPAPWAWLSFKCSWPSLFTCSIDALLLGFSFSLPLRNKYMKPSFIAPVNIMNLLLSVYSINNVHTWFVI